MTKEIDLEKLKSKILRAISPIKIPSKNYYSSLGGNYSSNRTNGGRSLPEYYLVYFLFVDLLGFKNLGQFEKVAWIIPIEYLDKYYTIEYRKFGLGIFGPIKDDQNCFEISKKIFKAVKIAEPYFESIAKSKIDGFKLNVINYSKTLFSRYQYFKDEYDKKVDTNASLKTFEGFESRQQEAWIALSAIDSFYSWTEQVFMQIGILQGKLKNGKAVIKFMDEDWRTKYKIII